MACGLNPIRRRRNGARQRRCLGLDPCQAGGDHDEADAHRMIHALAVGLVRDTYNLGDDASVVSEDGVAVNGRAGE